MATRPPHSPQQPRRPVRAPNGNGNHSRARAPVDAKKGKIKKPAGPIGKAAKFALTPEIGRSFEGLKFAWDLL
ncbi:MAG TPA: hypothetical protein PKW15_08620, partial [Alphaproteobacteria bacterium]|nr:hypothetical protein [Alphaproteobacteria bacterium]